MVQVAVLSVFVLGAPPPAEAFTASARITDTELKVNHNAKIELQVDIAADWSTAKAGIPYPILQIAVPKSARLTGRAAESFKDLSRNEFLHAPFERLLQEPKTEIGFELIAEPGPDEHFVLNLLAYLNGGSAKESYFVRRRLVLPLAPGAASTTARPEASDWSDPQGTLQIGQKAAPFKLSSADSNLVSLADYLGNKNIVIVTYRAHW